MKKNNFDVIIIGAGASGLTAAWNLGSKYNVLCLDQGPFINLNSKKIKKWNYKNNKKFKINPNDRKLKFDYPINNSNSDIDISNYNAIGGSTIIYSGHFPRLHPSDFRTKKLDKVGADWPIKYDDLVKHYKLNDKNMNIAGLKGDPAYPDSFGNLNKPLPIELAGEKLGKAFNKLGWHWWPSYSAVSTKNTKIQKKFIKSDYFNLLHPYTSKSSVDNTYLKLINRKNVKFLSEHRVLKIKNEDKNRVGSVICKNYINNKKIEFFASIIIVACGGIGSARLLLNSKNKFYPNGLANNSGLVGKNLMLHPLLYIEGKFNEVINSHILPQGCNVFSHEFYETNKKNNFKRGYTIHVLRPEIPLNFAKYLKKIGRLNYGKNFHRDFFDNYGRTIPIAVICEDIPNKKNKVELDFKNKDSLGMPGVKVFYKIDQNTKNMFSHANKNIKKLLKLAGAKKIISTAPVRYAGWHTAGTARMGSNRNNSVVNKYGQSHDIKNLYIIDSSIFPTSGAVNPVSTIQALSLRITDVIKKKFNP